MVLFLLTSSNINVRSLAFKISFSRFDNLPPLAVILRPVLSISNWRFLLLWITSLTILEFSLPVSIAAVSRKIPAVSTLTAAMPE